MQECLTAGTGSSDFKRRLKAALTQETTTTPAHADGPASQPSQEQATAIAAAAPARQPPGPATAGSDTTTSNVTVQTLLHDRKERLEAEQKRKEAAEKAERQAKAKARREEAEASAVGSSTQASKAPELSYAQQQRKRQQEARQERDRIMRQIESDKAERREREERRRALARAEAEAAAHGGVDGPVDMQSKSQPSQISTPLQTSRECALQVRLLDGSTIRSRFPSSNTLRAHVRPWIDEQRSDGDVPYTFKQILAPLPNQAITISDEEESLHDLGLTPSANMVLVPVPGSISAYGGSDGHGLFSRGLSAGYGLLSGGVGMVTGALGTFLGLGHGSPSSDARSTEQFDAGQAPSDAQAADTGVKHATGGINIRTLRDQHAARDDHQLYNGNQVRFCRVIH